MWKDEKFSPMTIQPADFAANIERFSGFANAYDQFRPAPPTVLSDILTQLAQTAFPACVVDLGCGTGLSTRYWADKAQTVIGIDPTDDMRRQAEAFTQATNITYRQGFSHQTGLPDQCAQIVTCSQSLHWMEPQATFQEVKRILQPGGVFAAYDYDWPPTIERWEAEAAYALCSAKAQQLEKERRLSADVKQWGKNQHVARMQASDCFRYTKEIVVHQLDSGNAERLIGLLLSQGGIMTLLKNGVSEAELGIDLFRETVQQLLGDSPQRWYWSSRMRIGIV
ncbi:hypothetical protein BH10CHL1_BH10CHL1_37390 [soil metagenome]